MKLTRRAVIQGFVAAVATVAIASRVAPKFLPESFQSGRWRYESVDGTRFYYGLDKDRPWEIIVFEKRDPENDESWVQYDVATLNHEANYSSEAAFAAGTIAMSQGMAALQVTGRGPFLGPGAGMSEFDPDEPIVVPNIETTREALFKHG